MYGIITKVRIKTEFLKNMSNYILKIIRLRNSYTDKSAPRAATQYKALLLRSGIMYTSRPFSKLLPRRFIIFFLLLISTFFFNAQAEDLTIKAVVIPGAPIITKDKKTIYGLELVFNKSPKEYWVYYSEQKKKLVVDFYGVHIKGKPKVDFSGRGVFKDFEIVNSKTKLSLSEKNSSVLIGLDPDPGWHFKAGVVDNRIVRIIAWRDISKLTKVETKKRAIWPYILLILLGASATFGIAIIINNYR